MDCQKRSIPYALEGHDLIVQSRTGSGKTAAFVLPILDAIDTDLPDCQALILVPTRELAKQVSDEAAMLAGDSGVRTVPIYGGAAYGPQLRALEQGAHLVVGTPGRVLDHLMQGTLVLGEMEILVLDEADRMLSMGFYPDMVKVQSFLPTHKVRAYMFSATFPPQVLSLSGLFLSKPITLSLSKDHVHVTDVLHVYYLMKSSEKDRSFTRIIEVENPTAAIVFCNTKRMVHYVTVVLQRYGWDADELSADLSQNHREAVLQRVRDGKLRILVATDVAARGLDIPELSHVFQYEPPADLEAYIHRAGRTGRAGASGRAISLAARDSFEKVTLNRIAKKYEIDLQERDVPSEEHLENLISQRVTARLEARWRGLGQLERERIERFVPLAQTLGEVEDESVLVAMLIDEYYQRSLREDRGVSPDEPPRASSREPGDRDGGGGGRGGGGGGRGGGRGGGGRGGGGGGRRR